MNPIKKDKTGRNDLCPCGSKKKYKKCHGGINFVQTQTPGQIDSQLKKITPKAVCLAPSSMHSACTKKIISAHTVSRSGSLGAIAKDGHVYSYAFSILHLAKMKGQLVPKLIGWKDASTFPGFCSHHDKQLFAPLEDVTFTGDLQQCFLLGFRSVAWELYAKLRAAKSSSLRTAMAAPTDRRMQLMVANLNHDNELNLRDSKAHKMTYDKALADQNWSSCHGLLIEFDQIFPIQCTGAWAPTVDINGCLIQDLSNEARIPQWAGILSFAADDKSYFLLTWLDANNDAASKLASSIEDLPKDEIAGAIAAQVLLITENCHFSPIWYDALSTSGKSWVRNLAHPSAVVPASTAKGKIYVPGIGVRSLRRF